MEKAEQLDLIDVEHPQAKPLKAAIRRYNTLIDEKNDAAGKAKEQRTKILGIVKEMGVKPDADGTLRFQLGETVIEVKQGEAKLHIKEKDPETDEPDEEQQVEGAEQQSRRRRVGNAD